MCFSSEASFGAGIVLTAIGIATLKKSKSSNEKLFASIPLIFAIQQITEGFLWLTLKGKIDSGFEAPTTYFFLFIAQVVWPTCVPLSILFLEKDEKRKIFLKILAAIGVFVTLYNIYVLFAFNFKTNIIGHHVDYPKEYPFGLRYVIGVSYILVTIFPPFLSSVKKMWIVSIAVLASTVITGIFYKEYFVSVWCFFASVISVTVLIVLNHLQNTNNAKSS